MYIYLGYPLFPYLATEIIKILSLDSLCLLPTLDRLPGCWIYDTTSYHLGNSLSVYAMDVSFSNYLHRFRFRTNADLQPESKTIHTVKESFQHCLSNILLWKKSLQTIGSWANSAKGNFRMPSINRELQQYTKSNRSIESGCSLPLFRPYVAKVPWHKGVRGFLSQLFPRYGHYCGPNWSSGKDNGLPLWDQRPIDWLDFCCYCHDIGYDTDDQAKLLKADLAFLECLEKPRMTMKGDTHAAFLYRSMCITGLRNILIPYRRQLVRLQSGQHLAEWLGNLKGKSNTFERT